MIMPVVYALTAPQPVNQLTPNLHQVCTHMWHIGRLNIIDENLSGNLQSLIKSGSNQFVKASIKRYILILIPMSKCAKFNLKYLYGLRFANKLHLNY